MHGMEFERGVEDQLLNTSNILCFTRASHWISLWDAWN